MPGCRTKQLKFLNPYCEQPALCLAIDTHYADDTTLMAENEEELKSLLMRVKEESEKTALKLNTQKLRLRNNNKVCHGFSSKEQASFNFMAVVTICSDFGAQENKVCHCFHCFPIYLP